MPNITVKIPEGVLDAAAQKCLFDGITAAAARCEQIPAEPDKRFLCWVMIEEIASSRWACGGVDVTGSVIPVVVQVNVPTGVLNYEARARYVELIHRSVTDALRHEKRRIATSCIISEIQEGTWGANGTIWRLPQQAAASGFEHLQHLVTAA